MSNEHPERDLVFATPVEGQKDSWIVDLSCGHRKAVRERKASYVCRECPREPAYHVGYYVRETGYAFGRPPLKPLRSPSDVPSPVKILDPAELDSLVARMQAAAAEAPAEKLDTAQCSFCDKGRKDCKKLISGRGNVYICDECVELCSDICGGPEKDEPSEQSLRARVVELEAERDRMLPIYWRDGSNGGNRPDGRCRIDGSDWSYR